MKRRHRCLLCLVKTSEDSPSQMRLLSTTIPVSENSRGPLTTLDDAKAEATAAYNAAADFYEVS